MGVLRVCWNIIPIIFTAAALAFTLLVLIAGTNANNDLADIYFMRVSSLLLTIVLTIDQHNWCHSQLSSKFRILQLNCRVPRSPWLLSKLPLGILRRLQFKQFPSHRLLKAHPNVRLRSRPNLFQRTLRRPKRNYPTIRPRWYQSRTNGLTLDVCTVHRLCYPIIHYSPHWSHCPLYIVWESDHDNRGLFRGVVHYGQYTLESDFVYYLSKCYQ
jgi:hypothetical protein